MTTSETTDGPEVDLAIDEYGSGPSLVFTHGWVDDRRVWAGTVDALAARHHCVTWDLRGHGESGTPPPGNYTRDHALSDLSRVLERADRPAVLVGHSLGGYLALAHTLRHPDDVRALVLVAAGPGFRNPEAREQWNDSVTASAAKLGVPEGSEEISKHVDSWVMDDLDAIDVPVLVVLGERDKRFAAAAGVFEKRLDVRASHVIADAGHNVHRNQPAAVAAAIASFLDEL